MSKKILALIVLVTTLLPFGCKYDDTELWNSVNDLDDRVGKLEAAVEQLNGNVKTLSDLMTGKLFIQSIEDKGNGVRVVHFINAAGEQSTMEIADGKDGQNGADGKDGQDGQDGQDGAPGADGNDGVTPVVSVRQDSDGNWYWTVNGDFILDKDGNKLRANGIDGVNGTDGKDGVNGSNGQDGAPGTDGKDGADGKDGQDGKDGADAIAPAFRIDNGRWMMSLDQGLTWIECGQATGKDGDAFFTDAQTSADGKLAYLTLADGTVLTFEIYSQFGISFDIEKTIVQEGQTRDISFTVTGMTPETAVEAIGKNGWEADTELGSDGRGTLTVTAPDQTGYGKVIVLLSDGADRTIMRTLTFLAGTVKASTSSVEVPTAGTSAQTVSVETNINFTPEVAEEAQSWLSIVPSGRADATRTETFQIKAEATDSPSPRSGLIYLKSDKGAVLETVLIVQTPVSFDATDLVFRVDPSQSTNTKGVILPIYAISGTITIDWGDGTEAQEITTMTTTTTRYPSHLYEDKARQYNVVVKGKVTNIQGNTASYIAGVTEIAQWGTGNAYTNVVLNNTPITYLPEAKGSEFAAVTKFDFRSNTKLVNISPKLFHGTTNKVKSLSSLFYNCSSLKSIPSGLFDGMTWLTTLDKVFQSCTSLTDVPADLLKDQTAVTNIGYFFSGCKLLTTLPADFFKSQTKVTTLQYLFQNCESLTSLPEDLLQPMKNTCTNLNYTFEGCSSLKTLPAKLFDGFTKVSNLNAMFSKCTGLEELPDGFFDFAQLVTNFQNLFDGCTSLRKLNSGFANNTKFTSYGISFGSMFRNCESLTSLPAGFIPEYMWNRCNAMVTMFSGCKSLESFPEGFFNGLGEGKNASGTIIKPANMNQTFMGCEKLKTIPFDIIFNSTGTLQLTSFSSAFSGCTSLTGTIPSYPFEYNGVTYNVMPWERADYNKSADADMAAASKKIFGTSTSISGSGCFSGCSKLTGYDNIPSTWGGANDGITAKPEVRVEIIHPEGMEYHAIFFDFYGKEVTTFKYYLSTTEDIKKYLPRYGNSLEQMVRDGGVQIAKDDYQSFFYAQLNSDTGAGLSFEDGDPDTEYGIIILVENSKGYNVSYTKASTSSMPKGSDAYEAYMGTWTVTPSGTSVEMAGVDENGNPTVIDSPAPSFDITVEPYRVDDTYLVSGWGYTKFNDHKLFAKFNTDTKAFELWNGKAGNVQVQTNYIFGPADNPDAKFNSYTVTYYGVVEDPNTMQYNYWGTGTDECILAGNLMGNRITMLGQRSPSASSAEYGDVYWAGFEALLCMGSMSATQYWTPVQVIRPEYVFTYNNIDLTLHHHGPYVLTRKSAANAAAVKARTSSNKSYQLNLR